MAYVILELFYDLWLGGIILSLINLFSTVLFGGAHVTLRQAAGTVWFTLIWPIGLLSPVGRKYLTGRFHQL